VEENQGVTSKNLPNSNGIIGDANQFDARAQGNEGVASVNLRGLGPQRTLVLLNGKRIVQSGGSGIPIVDVNLIPSGGIGRIEVLKDGAAATYGSDAIAGVVNFITRTDQEGFRASADYRYISGSDGDYGGALSYGHASVRARGVISGVCDGVFRGGACPTPECGVAGGHRAHRYGGVCTLQP